MRIRIGLKALLVLVVFVAVGLRLFLPFWERAGGMIGWTQSAIEARLGPPSQVYEFDVADPHAQTIRPRVPGVYRTLVFSRLDGRFVAWMKAEAQGYTCFGSSWSDKRVYYRGAGLEGSWTHRPTDLARRSRDRFDASSASMDPAW